MAFLLVNYTKSGSWFCHVAKHQHQKNIVQTHCESRMKVAFSVCANTVQLQCNCDIKPVAHGEIKLK